MYIKYLRQHDKNVCDPKDFGHTRPYVGILVYESNDFYWFAPLTSKTKNQNFIVLNYLILKENLLQV